MQLQEIWTAPGEDFSDALALRLAVFVDEQGFSLEAERDGKDSLSHHVVLYDGKKPVGCARLYEEEPGCFHAGRICVKRELRGKRLGLQLMELLEGKARSLGGREVVLGAQCRAQPFYERAGYAAYGEIYLEEACPHRNMRKAL